MTKILRQVKEYNDGVFTTFIESNKNILFSEDMEKGLDYFEKAGGTFLSNEVTGERIYGEIALDDILFMLQCLEDGDFEYDDNIYHDFMFMKECCLCDKDNSKRYCDDFFNICIL